MASLTPRLDKLDAGKNLIINGNFDFWQRTTSLAHSGAGVYKNYSADRWGFGRDTGAVPVTTARSTDVPSFAQSGYASNYSMLITATTGTTPPPGDSAFLTYLMEGFDYQQIHNRPVRLQFWVKSNKTGQFTITFLNNTINFGTARRYMTTYNINAANTWEKKTIDITMDSAPVMGFASGAGYESGNLGALTIDWGLQGGTTALLSAANQWQPHTGSPIGAFVHVLAGSTQWGTTTNDTFQLAQIQLVQADLESGADIPFQRAGKTIQDELAMCQRYYQKSFALDTTPVNGPASNQFATLTGMFSCCISRAGPWNGVEGYDQTIGSPIRFTVPMRAAPSITFYGNSSGQWFSFANVDGTAYSAAGAEGICEFQFHPSLSSVISTNTAQAIMGGHWAALSEL